MADFSIKSTNIGPTANAVAVQDTPVDQSLATAVGVVGRAAIQGAEVYKGYKSNQFEKEYDGLTEVGLGLKDPETPEEKSFRKTVERLNQIEGMGTPGSVSVAREVHLRQAMRDHPFLADSYMSAAGKSESKYSSIFKAIGDLEAQRAAQAAADAKEDSKWVKNKIDRMESMSNSVGGYMPSDGNGNILTWEDIIDQPELLRWNEAQLYLKQQSKLAHEKAMELRKIGREDAADARNIGRYNQSVVKFRQEQQAHASQQYAQNRTAEVINALQPKIAELSYSGLSADEQAVQLAQIYTEASRQLENDLTAVNASGDISLSRDDIRNAGEQVRAGIADLNQFYTGDFSDIKARQRNIDRATQGITLDAQRSMRPLMVLEAANIKLDAIASTAVVTALSTQAGADSQGTLADNITSIIQGVVSNPQTQTNLPPNTDPAGQFIRNIASNHLIAAARAGTETYNNFIQNPGAYAAWIRPTVAAYMEESNPRTKDQLFNAVVNDTAFQAIEAASPEQKQVALEGVQQALQYRIQGMPSPKVLSGMLDFDTEAEEFIPTDPKAEGYARLMNQTLRYALQTESAAGNISDIDTVSRKYFRIAIEPVEGEDGWNN